MTFCNDTVGGWPQVDGLKAQGRSKLRCALSPATGGMAGFSLLSLDGRYPRRVAPVGFFRHHDKNAFSGPEGMRPVGLAETWLATASDGLIDDPHRSASSFL